MDVCQGKNHRERNRVKVIHFPALGPGEEVCVVALPCTPQGFQQPNTDRQTQKSGELLMWSFIGVNPTKLPLDDLQM